MVVWQDAVRIVEGVPEGELYVLASEDGSRAVEAYAFDDCLLCEWYVESARGGLDLDVGNGRLYERVGSTVYGPARARLMRSEALTWVNDARFAPDTTLLLEWRDGAWVPRANGACEDAALVVPVAALADLPASGAHGAGDGASAQHDRAAGAHAGLGFVA